MLYKIDIYGRIIPKLTHLLGMTFRHLLIAAICSGSVMQATAQEPAAPATAPAQQYENWEQFSPQVRAALLFILAAGFESMATVEERQISKTSVEAHILFLEEVIKLNPSFITGRDREYFDTLISINIARMEALKALPPTATDRDFAEVRERHAAELKKAKAQYGYANVDAISMKQLDVMQQKYMQQCIAADPTSPAKIFRLFAEKLREESISQY